MKSAKFIYDIKIISKLNLYNETLHIFIFYILQFAFKE